MHPLRQSLLLLAGACLALAAPPAMASSHREAPMIAEDPTADNTDVYFFRSRENPDKVVILANYIPAEEPSAGPNYYYFDDQVQYDVNVDRNGDGRGDTTFCFRFKTQVQTPNTFLNYLGPITRLTTNGRTVVQGGNVNPLYNRYQTYDLTLFDGEDTNGRGRVLARNVIVPPNNAGKTTIPDYRALMRQAIHTVPGLNIRTFAGQVDDPFFIDLGAFFDLLRVRPFRSFHVLNDQIPLPNRQDAPDAFSGFNCHTLALEVPITLLTKTSSIPAANDPRRILGVFAKASRQRVTVLRTGNKRSRGKFVQVSRLGSPLVNELFIPLRDADGRLNKDFWNMSRPRNDERFDEYFRFPEPALRLAQLYPVLRPVVPGVQCDARGNCRFTQPRTDFLGGVTPLLDFAPDELRLDVSVMPTANPNRLGVIGGDMQGFPNGRRLGDDVVDIYMRAAAGALLPGQVTVGNFTGTRAAFLASIDFGDGVDQHEDGRFGFLDSFPFVPPAHPGTRPAHLGFQDPEREEPTPNP